MLSFFKLMQSYRSLCEEKGVFRRLFCRSTPLEYADELHTPIPQNAVLILPPSDYWALQATLNVKSEKEAASFGPALFELNDAYHYEAKKIGENSYSLIAYNPAEISLKLHSFNRDSMIDRITFSQWVFADESQPIHLSNGKVLTTLEGVVIEIDPDYIHANNTIGMSEALAHPRFFIKTLPVERLLTSSVTTKTLKITLILLLIVLGNLTTNALLNTRESVRLEELKEGLLDRANLPETSIEREAILSALHKKEAAQLRLRHQFLRISDLPVQASTPRALPPIVTPAPAVAEGIVLIPGSKPGEPNRLLVEGASSAPVLTLSGEGIKEIVYDGNSIKIIVDTQGSQAKENLKKVFSKKFKKVRFTERGNQLEVRIP
ncbi:MAG: hypothetical protein Q7T91_00105 [Sulfuricurvum sp.]|nr:hypothetical protein [Sulfuricurvum sp.]